MEYNIYCDESCHLEHDGISKMVLGCVWAPRGKIRSITESLDEVKRRHEFPWEMKWNKVGKGKIGLYRDVVDFFFGCPDLGFRCVVVDDKSKLNHDAFNAGSHDAFYYKMFYLAINVIIERINSYNIYLDLKDTQSTARILKLRDVLRTKFSDSECTVIPKIQPIRSHESVFIQLCDVLIGAVGYRNRNLTGSEAKLDLVRLITNLAGQRLDYSSPLSARKFNIFVFDPQEIQQ